MKAIVKLSLSFILFFVVAFEANSQSATDGTVDAINQMGETEIENIQNQWESLGNIGGTIAEGIGHLNTALGIFDDVRDMYEASNALDNNECFPDLSTDAQSMMPSSCGDQPGCQQCYQSNISRMTVVRRSLARLSCIRMNTKKFTDAAISFGDNVSGIHAVTGLAWQA